ncbi:MAG: hypothetical protein PHV18_13155 [Lachnospiraceae bacterium]|nr:hypothetical protein [Lachnospiraceae bacterium]
MRYIWINPVARAMYGYEAIRRALKQKEYECIDAEADWGGIVREKYRKLVQETGEAAASGTGWGVTPATVVDARCPKAYQMVKHAFEGPELVFGDIHPILIHIAIELSETPRYAGAEKIITTPCASLADEGNALRLQDTRFIPWNQFREALGLQLPVEAIEASPIPPGYFAGLPGRIDSISEEHRIWNYFRRGDDRGASLVEMLFCKDGCHNGDGV